MASALLLAVLADHRTDGSPSLFSVLESISGVAYVLIGAAGMIFAAGFLDTSIFGHGTPGRLISAGAIPVISVLIGIKVGAEISTLLVKLKNAQTEE
jgi:multicomponent Na+:H+ antiporter subunit B